MRCCFALVGCFLLVFAADAKDVTIGLNFSGSNLSESGFRPPDTMGTVGPGHIVEMINGRYRVYDKSNGNLQQNVSLNTFWANANAPHAGSFSFDPRVQFDPTVDRYFATSVDNASNANNFLFAVSNSANPLDGWAGFSIDADSDDAQWADFPQMGFSDDTVLVSANMFGLTGDFEINMLVLPKADLLTATPSIANAVLLEDEFAASGFNFSLQPAIDLQGSGRPLRMFTTESSFNDEVNVVQLDNPLTAPSLNVRPSVVVDSYDGPPLADQPGPKVDLDSGGSRTRSAVTLIDDHYYGVHGVDVDGRAALRWYKIDADTLQLASEGVLADDELNLIYGSIAANELGDIVVGFTATSPTTFAGAYAAVGETDSAGNVTFGELLELQAGVSDYEGLSSSGRNRWGDYSATVVDPDDPLTFWTFQEFVSSTDEWSIQISQLTLSIGGDFNDDGDYDCLDVDPLVAEIAAGTNDSAFDLTGDGLVKNDDLDAWLVSAGGINLGAGKVYLRGDANLDGTVDGGDFLVWNDNKFSSLAAWCGGDFNASGNVDGADFLIWNDNKFQSSDVISVPEPAAGWLVAWMLILATAGRRCRKFLTVGFAE